MNLAGQILISLPSIEDERFYKSVIYICAHSQEGSMGIIINKSLELNLYPSLLEQLGIDSSYTNKKIFFHYGGPLETGRGFILHSYDFIKKESIPIDYGIVLTSTIDFITDLKKGRGPKISILALGYAGWGPGQLEDELKKGSWLILPADQNLIFNTPDNMMWKAACKKLGINLGDLSGPAGIS